MPDPDDTGTSTAVGGSARMGMSPFQDFSPGQIIGGRYRVIRLLGRGGMAAVYAAADREFEGETVALKTMLPHLRNFEASFLRFKREIQLARRVTHPNACRIHEVGYHEAASTRIPFVTMEYLTGTTLREAIEQRGRFSTSEAMPIVRGMCAGLGAIHGANIVHRDLKTSNVMLVGEGPRTRTVITDFGLACLHLESDDSGKLTADGALVGSPAYMAPEQVQGLPPTPAADIFALGVVMFEMVTGVLPFGGESALALAVNRLTQPPRSPREIVPDIDPRWEETILRCLVREPSERFQNVEEVQASIDTFDPATLPTQIDVPKPATAPLPRPVAGPDEAMNRGPSAQIAPGPGMSASRSRALVAVALAGSLAIGGIAVWKRAERGKAVSTQPTSASLTARAAATPARTTTNVTASSPVPVATVSSESTPAPSRLPAPFATLEGVLQEGSPSLRLRTLNGKTRFRSGETIRYEITAAAGGFLYLVVFSNDNVASCIFPNARDRDNFISAGRVRVPRNDEYTFPIQEPYGTDLHVAVLSQVPLELGDRTSYSWDEVVKVLQSPAVILSRGVGVRENAKWNSASMVIESRR